jgi:hypothetical protein
MAHLLELRSGHALFHALVGRGVLEVVAPAVEAARKCPSF